jgi:hypothetical protein
LAALFALDQNFPEPIVAALDDYIVEAELVPVRLIDPQLAELDDWELLLALHHDARPWAGLVTTDSGILSQPVAVDQALRCRSGRRSDGGAVRPSASRRFRGEAGIRPPRRTRRRAWAR